MDFARSTARAMHDDHMATLQLLARLEARIALCVDGNIPDTGEPEWRRLLSEFSAAVRDEVSGHFGFEEASLFPILRQAGEEEMCRLLEEQHAELLPLGMRLADLAGDAALEGFTQEGWAEFRTGSATFIDGLRAHVDIEEASMVPALEDALEADQDFELIQAYRP